MFIRSYLRASTDEQDATRANAMLEQFAIDHGQVVASTYIENASGTELDRPELRRLLKDARKGDVILVESIDRLTRMEEQDWRTLKTTIDCKGLCIVALDLPTSHLAMKVVQGDEFTKRMLGAINDMMIEMMAAIARKHWQQLRDRQAQGIAKAKGLGVYKGRPINADLHKRVRELLAANFGIRATARHANCSTTTVMKIRDQLI